MYYVVAFQKAKEHKIGAHNSDSKEMTFDNLYAAERVLFDLARRHHGEAQRYRIDKAKRGQTLVFLDCSNGIFQVRGKDDRDVNEVGKRRFHPFTTAQFGAYIKSKQDNRFTPVI